MKPDKKTKPSRTGWTRRHVLNGLGATMACPATMAWSETREILPDTLADICRRAVAQAPQHEFGLAMAAGRNLSEIATTLLARLGPEAAEDWQGALIASARRDIAAGDSVETQGYQIIRTEAEVLALGVCLPAEL